MERLKQKRLRNEKKSKLKPQAKKENVVSREKRKMISEGRRPEQRRKEARNEIWSKRNKNGLIVEETLKCWRKARLVDMGHMHPCLPT